MHHLRVADAPTFDLPGVRFTALAAPSRGSAGVCTWLLDVEPGLAPSDPHVIDEDEVFHVVAGAIRLSDDGPVVRAGEVAVVPAGERIRLSNAGTGAAKVHVAVRAGFTATRADGTTIGTPAWAV